MRAVPLLQQGIRYGIAIALLAPVPVYLIYYAVQQLPGMMVVKQIVFDSDSAKIHRQSRLSLS